jgi:imidazolonepropionase-like amidohydrolase
MLGQTQCRQVLLSAMLIAVSVLVNPSFADTSIVHAGKLLDRPGQAPRGASSVLIRDGKIIEIRAGFLPASAFPNAANASIIDLREHFVLPGLIDAHVHLTSDKAGVAGQLAQVTDSTPTATLEAAWNARKTLAAGFTTVRNLGDGDGVTLALRDAIAAGKTIGPKIIDAGQSISVTSGHMDGRLGFIDELRTAIGDQNLCDGPSECRKAVRRQIGRGVDVIKIATTGGVNSRVGAGIGQQMFADEARAIVETAHLAGKKVAVHAHGNDGVRLALSVGADSIEHGTLLDANTIKMMKAQGTYLVPTLSTINGYKARLAADPNAYSPAVLEKIKWRIAITGKSFRAAHQAGVNIAFGTDAGVSLHGQNADDGRTWYETCRSDKGGNGEWRKIVRYRSKCR